MAEYVVEENPTRLRYKLRREIKNYKNWTKQLVSKTLKAMEISFLQ